MSTAGGGRSVSTAIWPGEKPQRASLERAEGGGEMVMDPESKVELGTIAPPKDRADPCRRMS